MHVTVTETLANSTLWFKVTTICYIAYPIIWLNYLSDSQPLFTRAYKTLASKLASCWATCLAKRIFTCWSSVSPPPRGTFSCWLWELTFCPYWITLLSFIYPQELELCPPPPDCATEMEISKTNNFFPYEPAQSLGSYHWAHPSMESLH